MSYFEFNPNAPGAPDQMNSIDGLGFTEEQEAALIKQSTESRAWQKKQDEIGSIRTVAVGASLLYVLVKMGDLISQMRTRRKGG
jgi:hypothetical protein